MYKVGNSVEQAFGGTIIKQGDQTPLGFNLRDENGELVKLSGATVQVKIANKHAVVLEKTATISDDYTIEFSIGAQDITGSGDMRLEFKVSYADGTQEKFPSNDWQRIKITPTLEDITKTGIAYITFEKMKTEFQAQINTTKGLLKNSGVDYPLINVTRDGVSHPVDSKVKDTFLNIKVIGAKQGKYYAIEWLGNGYDDNGTIRYGFTIAEYDKNSFGSDSMASRKLIAYYRTNNFAAPTENVVTRVLDIPEESITFVITYDRSKIGGTLLRVAEGTYGVAKGAVIHEDNYVYTQKKGYLSENSGVQYPLKNVKRNGVTYVGHPEIEDAVLDVKIFNAKKGKKYKIDFLANGTTAWGDPNYSIYLQEMDDDFQNIVQLFNRTNHSFPAPTSNVVTRVVTAVSTDVIMSVTIDYSKLTKPSYVMNTTSSAGYGYIVDESCYIYSDRLAESTSSKQLAAYKTGTNNRVKFRYSDTQDMILDFDLLGINEITHLKRFYLQTRTNKDIDKLFSTSGLWYTLTTDWISPYGIMAVNNTLNSASYTVGGNHGTNGGSGFPTARRVETAMYADGKLLNDGESAFADEVIIKSIHHIAASNVINTSTGEKRDCVKEIVTYTIRERHVKVSVELEALEPVKITRYCGPQATRGMWENELYFMNDVTPQVISLTDTNYPYKESAKKPESEANQFVLKKDGNVLVGYFNQEFGIGDSKIADGQPVIHLSEGQFGKVYAHLIRGNEVLLDTGKSIYWVGGYILAPDLTKSVAKTAYSYYEKNEKVYVLDFFQAGETFFVPGVSDWNKQVQVINKTASITIESFVTGKGVKINSTGYGQVKFKLV